MAIENPIDEALTNLEEECAEIIQAITKLRRFGRFGERAPEAKYDNVTTLCHEMGQAVLMMAVVVEVLPGASQQELEVGQDQKLKSLQKWSGLDLEQLQVAMRRKSLLS
jgi:hypothetical protein